MNITETLKQFTDKFDPSNKAMRRALSLAGQKQAELFHAIVMVVSAEDRSIVNLNKLASKFFKFPSSYINELRKRGLVSRGRKKGEWFVSTNAISLMQDFLSGAQAVIEDGSKKKVRDKTKKRQVRPVGIDQVVAKMTIGEVFGRMKDIDAQIEHLHLERANLEKGVRSFLKKLKVTHGSR